MAEVTAVIPTWNQRELLVRLLRDLGRQTRPPMEVIVVDNGSMDDSVAAASRHGARVISLGRNVGFCSAVNRGIRESRGDWVAILNNDVRLEPGWLERLMDAAQATGAWFAAGKIYREGSPATLDATFDAISRAACAWRCGQGRTDGPAWSQGREVSFIPFTAALLRKELFHRVGLLDEEFESYLEDVDFGLRCAVSGHTGRYVPQAVAHHRGSATLGAWHPDTVRRMARNQVLLVAKHYPPHWWIRFGWPVLIGQLLWGFVAARHGRGWAYLRGKLDGLRRFRRLRRQTRPAANLDRVLRQSEDAIHRLQQETGFDRYWRAYFLLT